MIYLQDVLGSAPLESDPVDGTDLVTIRGGVVRRTKVLTPAERAAKGERVWVSGYSVSGEPSTSVQAAIDALVVSGWPLDSILWDDLGEQPTGTAFVIQDCASVSTTEDVALVQIGGAFAIADCLSSSTADNVTISNPEMPIFVIQYCVSTSSTENLDMVQTGGTFTVADSVSASTADNFTMSQGASAPSAPTITSVTPGDAQNVIDLGTSATATSYNLYWSTTETTAANIKANGTKITGASDPYTHTGLANGTTYRYVQTAVNAAGESGPSAVVSGVPAASVSEVTFIAAGTAFNSTTSGSDTIALPGAAGDFLILYANSPSITATPAGWTAADVGSARLYYRISDGAPSVTLDTYFDGETGVGTSALIRAFAFRGVNTATPFDVVPSVVAGPATAAASISTPITTVSAKAMVVALSGQGSPVAEITGASGDTPNLVGNIRNTAFNSNLSLAYGLQSTVGAKSAVFNFAGNVTANVVKTTVLALKPA